MHTSKPGLLLPSPSDSGCSAVQALPHQTDVVTNPASNPETESRDSTAKRSTLLMRVSLSSVYSTIFRVADSSTRDDSGSTAANVIAATETASPGLISPPAHVKNTGVHPHQRSPPDTPATHFIESDNDDEQTAQRLSSNRRYGRHLFKPTLEVDTTVARVHENRVFRDMADDTSLTQSQRGVQVGSLTAIDRTPSSAVNPHDNSFSADTQRSKNGIYGEHLHSQLSSSSTNLELARLKLDDVISQVAEFQSDPSFAPTLRRKRNPRAPPSNPVVIEPTEAQVNTAETPAQYQIARHMLRDVRTQAPPSLHPLITVADADMASDQSRLLSLSASPSTPSHWQQQHQQMTTSPAERTRMAVSHYPSHLAPVPEYAQYESPSIRSQAVSPGIELPPYLIVPPLGSPPPVTPTIHHFQFSPLPSNYSHDVMYPHASYHQQYQDGYRSDFYPQSSTHPQNHIYLSSAPTLDTMPMVDPHQPPLPSHAYPEHGISPTNQHHANPSAHPAAYNGRRQMNTVTVSTDCLPNAPPSSMRMKPAISSEFSRMHTPSPDRAHRNVSSIEYNNDGNKMHQGHVIPSPPMTDKSFKRRSSAPHIMKSWRSSWFSKPTSPVPAIPRSLYKQSSNMSSYDVYASSPAISRGDGSPSGSGEESPTDPMRPISIIQDSWPASKNPKKHNRRLFSGLFKRQ